MKRVYKITAWGVGGIVLLCACVIGVYLLKDVLNPDFKETKIYPDRVVLRQKIQSSVSMELSLR